MTRLSPAADRSGHEGPCALLAALLEIVVAAVFVSTFIVEPARIPSASMEPTLKVGDLVLLDRQSYAPAGPLDRMVLPVRAPVAGDIAVFRLAEGRLDAEVPGGDSTSADADAHTLLIKRVVAAPGDVVRLHAGRLLLNGKPPVEPYAFYSLTPPNEFRDEFPSFHEADPAVDPRWWAYLRNHIETGGGVAVPPGSYFMLGDNRNDSQDSRYWGFVTAGSLLGKPLFTYWHARPNRSR